MRMFPDTVGDLAEQRIRLTIAHIDAERDLQVRFGGEDLAASLYSAAAISDILRTMLDRLPPGAA